MTKAIEAPSGAVRGLYVQYNNLYLPLGCSDSKSFQ